MMEKNNFEEYKNEVMRWTNELLPKSEEFLCVLETKLKDKDFDGFIELLKTSEAKEYANNESLVVIDMFARIYLEEKEANIEHKILDKGYSIKEYIELFKMVKHAIWRVEFGGGMEEEERIKEIIVSRNLSPYFLISLIKSSANDKVLAAYRLAGVLRMANMDLEAVKLLNYADEIQPNDEYILCELADIFVKYSRIDVAMKFVAQIINPTSVVNEYLKKWENVYADN